MTTPRFRQQRIGSLGYLVAPAARTSAAPHPVLCFLHGYDEGAPMPIEAALTRHGPLRPHANEAAAKLIAQFVVVAPQLPQRGDLWHQCAGVVQRVVNAVREEHGGDVQRTYLTGFSFGGNGVFDLAVLQPHYWAALWAVDPTRPPTRDPHCPVWLSAGEAARFRRNAFVRALQLQEDTSGKRVYVDEGDDHVGSATRAYQDARIYEWLLGKRLPE